MSRINTTKHGKSYLPKVLQRDESIVKTAFSGYLIWSMIVLVALSLLILFFKNPVIFSTMQLIIIYSAMAIGYDYFSGFSGYYNLGYGAFVGLGAYVFILASNAYAHDLPPLQSGIVTLLSLLLAGGLTALFAIGMSYPFLRLRGAYFAIATLALIFLLSIVFQNFAEYTGGVNGIHVDVSVPGIQDTLYVGSLLFLLFAILIHYYLGNTRLNLAFKSLKEEEEVTESFGVNTFRVKQIGLALSGFFGGVCGALYAINLVFINTQNAFSPILGITPVVASMSGGSGIFIGPVIGSFILASVNQYFAVNTFLTLSPVVITGVLLIFVGLFVPGGLLRIRALAVYAYKQPDRKITALFRKRKNSKVTVATEKSTKQ